MAKTVDAIDLSFKELPKVILPGTRVVLERVSSNRSSYKFGTLISESPKKFYLKLDGEDEGRTNRTLLRQGDFLRADINGGKPYCLY
jgi:hypothetical protein